MSSMVSHQWKACNAFNWWGTRRRSIKTGCMILTSHPSLLTVFRKSFKMYIQRLDWNCSFPKHLQCCIPPRLAIPKKSATVLRPYLSLMHGRKNWFGDQRLAVSGIQRWWIMSMPCSELEIRTLRGRDLQNIISAVIISISVSDTKKDTHKSTRLPTVSSTQRVPFGYTANQLRLVTPGFLFWVDFR